MDFLFRAGVYADALLICFGIMLVFFVFNPFWALDDLQKRVEVRYTRWVLAARCVASMLLVAGGFVLVYIAIDWYLGLAQTILAIGGGALMLLVPAPFLALCAILVCLLHKTVQKGSWHKGSRMQMDVS